MAKILIIEDNEMNLDMLSRRLQKRGHNVLIAMDGAVGVDMAHSSLPNIILMDMSLPIMDGWEATRRIRNSDVTRHIPIIALTAHALAEDRQRCLDAGCNEYETKPVKFPELMVKINTILGIQDEEG